MNISINEVTPETVCIHGQTLARPYVEMVLLPLLVASKGQNHGAILQVAQVFSNAGLSLQGSPEAARIYREHLAALQAEKARQRAEARAHAERCRIPTAEDIAKANAERERKNREIREHGERIRAARSASYGRSGPITGNWLDRS